MLKHPSLWGSIASSNRFCCSVLFEIERRWVLFLGFFELPQFLFPQANVNFLLRFLFLFLLLLYFTSFLLSFKQVWPTWNIFTILNRINSFNLIICERISFRMKTLSRWLFFLFWDISLKVNWNKVFAKNFTEKLKNKIKSLLFINNFFTWLDVFTSELFVIAHVENSADWSSSLVHFFWYLPIWKS